MQKVLVSDPGKCTGCGVCQIVCGLHHAKVCNPERSRIQVIDLKAGGRFLPLTCQHCEDAPCAAACPKEAIRLDSGQVRTLVDYDRCVGCRMCVFACPFGAMRFDADRGRPYKCDLCGGDPLCVAFCEPGALAFVPADRITDDRRRASALYFTAGRPA